MLNRAVPGLNATFVRAHTYPESSSRDMSEPTATVPGQGRKRKRLTHACSQCRSRKIRCDEAHPKCTNCTKAGTECITLDTRNPGVAVERREAQKPARQSLASPVCSTRSQPSEHDFASQAPSIFLPPQERRSSPNEELLPALPRLASGHGSSLSMLSQWLDLAFQRLGIARQLGSDNSTGEERATRSRKSGHAAGCWRGLSASDLGLHARTFMSSLNTVFPIFTPSSMDNFVAELEGSGRCSADEKFNDIRPILMVLLVVINHHTTRPDIANDFLDVALSSFQVTNEYPSIHSIQALFLISLIHRSRDEIVLASNMIILAASHAQSLGLHRRFSRRQLQDLGEEKSEQYTLVWWSVYTLEKIISLELGRLSTIRDFECNQMASSATKVLPSNTQYDLFLALTQLARLQSEMSERFASSRHMEETTDDIEHAIGVKMAMVGELDQKLLDWTQSLPPHAQTLSDTIGDPELKFAMPFLALQYWQTLFLLHRNALLLNPAIISGSADKHCGDRPYRFRIKSGYSICCNSARTIVSILNDAYEQEASSVLRSSYAPLTAVYALGIHILRNPRLGLARADLEIQASGAAMIARHQHEIGTQDDVESQALRALLGSLQSEVAARLNGPAGPSPGEHSQTSNPSPSAFTTPDHTDILSALQPESRPAMLSHNIQPLLPFNTPFAADMPGFGMATEFPLDAMDLMDIDWETLALTYALPSQ